MNETSFDDTQRWMQQMQQQVWRLYMLNDELYIARIKKRTSASSVAEKKGWKESCQRAFFSEKVGRKRVWKSM